MEVDEIHSLVGSMIVPVSPTIEDWVDRPSGHNSSCYGGRVKTAGGLPAVVGTTRLSCGWVAGMDSASSHGASCYGEVKTVGGLLSKVGTTSLSCGAW
ncbi:hypothetical protein CRG98_013273 [Punica granatum]|uniref:Uncharacterized protein n=1 Tax=Punica granatum TaxID=22663 RepID=A0A2I0KCQ3_PUNGR|nr:hypothetical protein CRG98_013273 [Punica granatum]